MVLTAILLSIAAAKNDDLVTIPPGQYTYSRLAQILSTATVSVSSSSRIADRLAAVTIKSKPRAVALAMLEKGLDVSFEDPKPGSQVIQESDAARISDARKLAAYNGDYDKQLQVFVTHCAQQIFPVPRGPSLEKNIESVRNRLNEISLSGGLTTEDSHLFNYVRNFNCFVWLWALSQGPSTSFIQESPLLTDETCAQFSSDGSYPVWLRSYVDRSALFEIVGSGPKRIFSTLFYDPSHLCLELVEGFFDAEDQTVVPLALPGFSCDSTVVSEDSDQSHIPRELKDRMETTRRFLKDQGAAPFKRSVPYSAGLALLEWAKESDCDLVAEISGIRGATPWDTRNRIASLQDAFQAVRWLWDKKSDYSDAPGMAWYETEFQTSLDLDNGVLYAHNELRFLDSLARVPYSQVETLIEQPESAAVQQAPALAVLRKIALRLDSQTIGSLSLSENQGDVKTIALLGPLFRLMSILPASDEQRYWHSLEPEGALKIPLYLFPRTAINRFVRDWQALIQRWHAGSDIQVFDPEFLSEEAPYALRIQYDKTDEYLSYSITGPRTSECEGAGHVALP